MARYSDRMTTGKIAVGLAAALLLISTTGAHGEDIPGKRGSGDEHEPARTNIREQLSLFLESDTAPALAAAPAQGFSTSPVVRASLFVRGAFPLLNVTAEESFAITAGTESEGETISASRMVSEVGWGGGLRLMSGAWGVEGSYSIFKSLALSPSWLVSDDSAGSESATWYFDVPFAPSRAGLLVGQLLRTFEVAGGGAEVSLGIGAGWMRVTDSSTDRLLSGIPFEEARQQFQNELPPDVPFTVTPEIEFTADRTSAVYVGSLGVGFRVGRIQIRPRVDVIFATRALTTDLTVGFGDIDDPLFAELGEFEMHFGSSVKPTIFLIAVDIGS